MAETNDPAAVVLTIVLGSDVTANDVEVACASVVPALFTESVPATCTLPAASIVVVAVAPKNDMDAERAVDEAYENLCSAVHTFALAKLIPTRTSPFVGDTVNEPAPSSFTEVTDPAPIHTPFIA
jgi:hypothetical protein